MAVYGLIETRYRAVRLGRAVYGPPGGLPVGTSLGTTSLPVPPSLYQVSALLCRGCQIEASRPLEASRTLSRRYQEAIFDYQDPIYSHIGPSGTLYIAI